jgi:hypothetical protein
MSSVTSPNEAPEDVAENTSWEPVTMPPAPSAMTMPAHTSLEASGTRPWSWAGRSYQGQHPTSLPRSQSVNKRIERERIPIQIETALRDHRKVEGSRTHRAERVGHLAALDALCWVTGEPAESGRFGVDSFPDTVRAPLDGWQQKLKAGKLFLGLQTYERL